MKIKAARARDAGDIKYLSTLCGVHTLQDALDVYEEVFPGRPIEKDKLARLADWYEQSTEWIPRLEPIVGKKNPLSLCGHPMSKGKYAKSCVLPSAHRGQHRSKYR